MIVECPNCSFVFYSNDLNIDLNSVPFSGVLRKIDKPNREIINLLLNSKEPLSVIKIRDHLNNKGILYIDDVRHKVKWSYNSTLIKLLIMENLGLVKSIRKPTDLVSEIRRTPVFRRMHYFYIKKENKELIEHIAASGRITIAQKNELKRC